MGGPQSHTSGANWGAPRPSPQTQPGYLARLIFQMPQNKSTKFMESVIFTLYNYASNPREAYLLLQLFKAALQEEIRWVAGGVPQFGDKLRKSLETSAGTWCFPPAAGSLPLLCAGGQLRWFLLSFPPPPPRSKVDHIHDILMGNATVIRLVVSFYRNARGQNALRQILGGPVQEVLQDKTLSIRTDPVDIYKAWVNQMESQSGQKRSGAGEGSSAQPQGGRDGDGDFVFCLQQAPIRGQP